MGRSCRIKVPDLYSIEYQKKIFHGKFSMKFHGVQIWDLYSAGSHRWGPDLLAEREASPGGRMLALLTYYLL